MISIIAVGKLKEKAYKDLVDEYVKRLSAYDKVEITEVADETNQLEETKVKKLEGERIIKAIKKDSFVVLLDLRGRMLNSKELAMKLDCPSITFPLISAGIFGYPLKPAWRQAIRACDSFIHRYPDYEIDIIFAVLEDRILGIIVMIIGIAVLAEGVMKLLFP